MVGVGCKLPGGLSNSKELLTALRNSRDCITEIPPSRWSLDEFYDPDANAPGKMYTRHSGFVSDIDRFDASFFGISHAEARRMDPQHRMLLETVWHALEDAGQPPDELAQSETGVFLGMMGTNDYRALKADWESVRGITSFDAVGDAPCIAAGRISYTLGLEGPCVTIDTACSSSLVAVHLACQSLLAGECETAIVAGVSALLHPNIHIAFSKLELLARDGRCKAFDVRGDGYVRGEGCVAAVLRRQSAAVARRDYILANIVGSAINQDGQTAALTAPNGRAQEKVLRKALARAGVNPADVSFVEAHGTGTALGDPTEMGSLVNVFGVGRSPKEPLYVGSIKSNVGHLEAAAGLLGLVKAALSLDQEQIFPNLHFTRFNPKIDLRGAPVRVPTSVIPWRRGRRSRLAGVNSFGYSGTNAHAILQEAPASSQEESLEAPTRAHELVVMSAKSEGRLSALVDKWIDFLEGADATLLSDIAFTAGTGRAHMNHRLAVVGRSRDEVAGKLRSWREGREPRGLAVGASTKRRAPKTAFVFTGQGSQYVGMGRQLYDTEPHFRATIDRCAAILDPELGTPIREVLFGGLASALDDTRYTQPALFVLEYALAHLLRHWGVEPDFVIGHSVGEIVAACVARAFSLEDALRFVAARGRLMSELPGGGKMVALEATQEEVRDWISGSEDSVSLSAENGPRSVVVSGAADAVDAVAVKAAQAGRRAKALTVSHAFHSPLMEPMLDGLGAVADSLRMTPPEVPLISNLTGDFVNGELGQSSYWTRHAREAVLFQSGMSKLMEAGCTVVVEIGPHPTLTPAWGAAQESSKLLCVPTLARNRDDVESVLEALAGLYTQGAPLSFDRLFESEVYRRVHLPTYPFQRDRHWLESEPREGRREAVAEIHPLLGNSAGAQPGRTEFETRLAATEPWADHRVLGSVVFPATGYIDMAARGFIASKGRESCALVLRDVQFEHPLVLENSTPKSVHLTLEDQLEEESSGANFTVSAVANGRPVRHCRGRVALADGGVEQTSLEALLADMQSKMEVGSYYGEIRKAGLDYGPIFSTVKELWLGWPGAGEAVGRIQVSGPGEGAEADTFRQSVLLDGCLQVTYAALQTAAVVDVADDSAPTTVEGPNGRNGSGTVVPARVESITIHKPLPEQVWSHVRARADATDGSVSARLRVFDERGELLVDIDTLQLRPKNDVAASKDGPFAPASPQLLAILRGVPKEERFPIIMKWLQAELKEMIGPEAEDFDPYEVFIDLGMDSLLMTDLQRRLQQKLGFSLPPMQGLDYESLDSLAKFLLEKVLRVEEAEEMAANENNGDRVAAAEGGAD